MCNSFEMNCNVLLTNKILCFEQLGPGFGRDTLSREANRKSEKFFRVKHKNNDRTKDAPIHFIMNFTAISKIQSNPLMWSPLLRVHLS